MTRPIDDRKKTDRGQRGRFAPGNTSSPGRPPGRGPVAEMRAALATDLDKIIDTLKAQALAGDAQAIRIILDRVLPALRPGVATKNLPAYLAWFRFFDQALGVVKPRRLLQTAFGVPTTNTV